MNKYDSIIEKLTCEQKVNLISQIDYCKKSVLGTNVSTLMFDDKNLVNDYINSLNDTYVKSVIANTVSRIADIYIVDLKSFIDCDSFIKKHYTSLIIETLNDLKFKTALRIHEIDDLSYLEYTLHDELDIINKSRPNYVICDSFIQKELLSNYNPQMEFIINSNNINDLVNAINNGYSYIITSEETQEELKKVVKYTESNISLTSDEKHEKEINCEIINIKRLEIMLEKRFDNLNTSIDSSATYSDYTNFLNERCIVFKNELLPISKDEELVIIGDVFNKYYIDIEKEICEFARKCKYQLFGYSNLEDTNYINDILDKTFYNKSLFFIELDNDGNVNQNEIKILEALHTSQREVIVVLIGNKLNKEVYELADNLILAPSIDICSKTIFEIVYGAIPASARTLSELNLDDVKIDKYIGYGQGLVEFKNVTINDNLVEFVVENTSENIIEPTIFLSFDNKVIGFEKTLLKAHEFKPLRISYDYNDLKVYDQFLKSFKFENTNYKIDLTDFKTSVCVDIEIDNTSDNTRAESFESTSNYQDNYKQKIIISSFISIYLEIMLIIGLFTKGLNLAVTISLIVVMVLILAIYLCILIKTIKDKKKYIVNKYQSDKEKNVDFSEFAAFSVLKNEKYDTKESVAKVQDIISETQNDDTNETVDNTVLENEASNKEDMMKIINPEVENVDFDSIMEESTESENIDDATVEFERIENAKDIDLNVISKGFVSYLETKGLTINLNTVKMLFASISTSKFIVLNSNDLALEERLVNALQEYLSNEVLTLDMATYDSFVDATKSKEFELAKFISNSKELVDNVSILYVKNATKDKFNNILKPFIVQNENNTSINVTINNSKVSLPKNAFFIISSDKFASFSDLTLDLDLEIISINESSNTVEPITLSVSSIYNLIKNNETNYYIPEKEFKKFDSLYESLGGDSLSNRSTIDFEKMYVVLHSLEFELNECIDILLRERIVPLIIMSNYYKNNREEVINLVSKIFDDKIYPLSLKALKNREDK